MPLNVDPKEVYNETYANAIEGGSSEAEAREIAEEAMIDTSSSLVDYAMDILKYGE